MRSRMRYVLLLGVVLATTAACESMSSEEWAEWRKQNAHFASFQHMGFSLRNRAGQAQNVTRRDIEAARAEGWWGKVITVSPEQIFKE